jgi:hypothetical protein
MYLTNRSRRRRDTSSDNCSASSQPILSGKLTAPAATASAQRDESQFGLLVTASKDVLLSVRTNSLVVEATLRLESGRVIIRLLMEMKNARPVCLCTLARQMVCEEDKENDVSCRGDAAVFGPCPSPGPCPVADNLVPTPTPCGNCGCWLWIPFRLC